MNQTPTPPTLAGLRVAAFEARMEGPMADLIRKFAGEPVAAPALREVPLADHREALDFARRLVAGDFDVVLFETGVGVRYLADAIDAGLPGSGWLDALARTKVVARGPKPVAALRERKVRIDLAVPEPNTYRETFAALDARLPVAGLRVAVQEYGQSSPELLDGLRQRGADVTAVPIYRWGLPEDLAPLRAAIEGIGEGTIHVVLLTAAQQVVHLLQVAGEMGREPALRAALGRSVIVGSVGPTTSEALRARGLPVDIEPEHPKMGHLVVAVAHRWRDAGKVAAVGPA